MTGRRLAHRGAGADARPPAPGRHLLTISGWNALSRVTGFLRVLAVGAALGTTFLGNVYQSSNLVSTVLFELLAAGLLSAPLVPAFVSLLDQGRKEDAERLAGTLLAGSLVALGVLTVVLLAARHDVMRLLTMGMDDGALRRQEVRVGAFLLWFFLPQLLLYAAGAVAGAALNAQRRFSAAAFAPVANNVVVVATMALFATLAGARRVGLDLSPSLLLVLGLGTTGGVLAMSAVPVLALLRTGFRLRPRLELGQPHLRGVVRLGLWGAVLLAGAQVLVATTVVLANRQEGGVVAYQIAYTFFLLPVALIAHPIFTALYPSLASHAHAGRWAAFDGELTAGARRTALLVLPSAALLAALAQPVLAVVRLGALDAAGAGLVARVLVAYAAGLVGYALFLLFARAATAAGDAASPALVGLAVAAAGAVLMVVTASAASGGAGVVSLGVAHSLAVTVGAGAMVRVLRRRHHLTLSLGPTMGRALVAAGGVWAVARLCSGAIAAGGRLGAALDVTVGGAVAVAAGAVVLWVLREPELRAAATRRAWAPTAGDPSA